jgi:hypothetical protein
MVNVELETLEIVFDDRNQSVVFLPLEIVHFRCCNGGEQFTFRDTDERQHFLDIGQPENTGVNGILSFQGL